MAAFVITAVFTPGRCPNRETIWLTKEARLLLHKVLFSCNRSLFLFAMKALSVDADKMTACRHFSADTREPDDMSRSKTYEWHAFSADFVWNMEERVYGKIMDETQ